MTALAFLDNYQRIRQQFYGATLAKPRAKAFPQIVYDKPVGPTIPAFWVSDAMSDAHRLIEGGFNSEAIKVKDPFALKRAVRQLVADIALIYGLTADDIFSQRRTRTISAARHHVMFEIAQRTEWSLSQIGRFLGRDHTTVLHGVRLHKERIENGEVTL